MCMFFLKLNSVAIDPCEMSHTELLSSSVESEGLHEFVHHYLNASRTKPPVNEVSVHNNTIPTSLKDKQMITTYFLVFRVTHCVCFNVYFTPRGNRFR